MMWRTSVCSLRLLCTSSNSSSKVGQVMKKVLGRKSKRKKILPEVGILPKPEMFNKGSCDGKYSVDARRVSRLNKLFMKHITDLLATGEYASDFTGRGIEITRVQISPDYNALNVFWITKNTTDSENIEKLLKKNAGFLRHELSSLRVMGAVPVIQFVKDKHHFQVLELDSRLAKIDFGEEGVFTRQENKLKTELQLFTFLSSDIKNQLQEIHEGNGTGIDEQPLPSMPQDVLGVDHARILTKIKKETKFPVANSELDDHATLYQSTNGNSIEFLNIQERKKVFKQFLEKREILLSKTRKLEKSHAQHLEYIDLPEDHTRGSQNFEEFEDEADFVIIDSDSEK